MTLLFAVGAPPAANKLEELARRRRNSPAHVGCTYSLSALAIETSEYPSRILSRALSREIRLRPRRCGSRCCADCLVCLPSGSAVMSQRPWAIKTPAPRAHARAARSSSSIGASVVGSPGGSALGATFGERYLVKISGNLVGKMSIVVRLENASGVVRVTHCCPPELQACGTPDLTVPVV